jgi:serine/threonine protein kinase
MKYVKQIASALKYMHEELHICHYDVKPANILLDNKGNAVLIDFGISKNYDAQGQETTTTPIGMSEGYAPIEQYQQNVEEFSPVSDVYALGATLYYLLHGKRPVSAVHRASGTALLMSKQLSQDVKDIINASMKISKRERANSVDVFLGSISTSAYRGRTIIQDDDESTILDGNQRINRTNTTNTQSYTTSPVGNTIVTENNSSSTMGWIIGITVVVIIGFFIYNSQGDAGNSSNVESYSNHVEATPPSTTQSQETETDIYKERVEQFAKRQSGVIASYPNDKRYSVYYSKKTTYGHKEMYRYNAVSDKAEKLNLPIEATIGYTDSWLTKNRYIFVAAEERYIDFIKIDTETGQIRYITDCHSVERTSSGFTVTKARCINEETATCSADMEYAYTDYYYDEEGNCLGHREEYR